MRKVLAGLGLALSAGFMATSANAATIMVDTSVPAGGFSNDNVTCAGTVPCMFSDLGSFVTPIGFNLVSLTISTAVAGSNTATNIDFGSVLFNNVAFSLTPTGLVEFGSLTNQSLTPGATNTLVVNGATGGNASYRGTLSFANVGAVPEPGTWAMMLLGFGMLGFGMRRRTKVQSRVNFSMA